ncbi:hypothetical protein [Mucilaginibacter aquatilis]|uniref:Uncharacterized protein n=1 Tax=Mucilaginibacter aquatilis TaxID=1517760 RepID=A0A6I4IC44_9SPHI|nr:hypothetical protein [Mucilaginibacter aquatilis]MVN91438.1 hypothetical protein [Mucilaginibacter aquatilis]
MITVNHFRNRIKKLHYVSGLTLSLFIGFHLINHLYAIAGPERHIAIMDIFRKIYRNPIVETLLLLVVFLQVITGVRLAIRRKAQLPAERLHVYSGWYLAFFLIAHVGAVLSARFVQHLDTNFYFGAVGLNFSPSVYLFVPYYFLGVAAISIHVAAIHYLKTGSKMMSYGIGTIGIMTSTIIILAFTNCFQGRAMPVEYINFMKAFFGN